MGRLHKQSGRCVNLVKALPHASGKYDETVCCAGISPGGSWVRQHPVPYRTLLQPQKFRRWDIIQYEFTDPGHDGRYETQRVEPNSIQIVGKSSAAKEQSNLNSMLFESTSAAAKAGHSLTLIRPSDFEFFSVPKSQEKIDKETKKHAAAAAQESMFHGKVSPFEVCPLEFKMNWRDATGKKRSHTCEDWETTTTYQRRLNETRNADMAFNWLKEKYENDYRQSGVVFALGTHLVYQKTWLLVGIIRLNEENQPSLNL
ncbi:hypothetical protein [Hyphobacterium sp.]|uniref:hypothetical protein n=1 Tax=Hyphobacterium sp. TaxID=2004662 RepID=UPI003BAC83EB